MILVVIPVHCPSPVACLTIGSFLETLPPNVKVRLHVGIHSNYGHYTDDRSMFKELDGIAQIHTVDEIDWVKYNDCVYRYSLMHAVNLSNLFNNIRYYDFEHVIILDQDLNFNGSFVNDIGDADLYGSLFENIDKPWEFTKLNGEKLWCMPKISIWHTAISRKLFNKLIDDTGLIHPTEMVNSTTHYKSAYNITDNMPLFFDTFARVLHQCLHNKFWDYKVKIVDAMNSKVDHFYKTSFNYGRRQHGHNYENYINSIEQIYKSRFPDGIQKFKSIVS